MDLKKLELIEKKLMKIRDILIPEDAYVVCDAIIISSEDELLESHIADMLKSMGYDKNVIKAVCKLVYEIQH